MLTPPTNRRRRPLVLASVMAAMFMIAIEATIVSTAMPQIAGQLGDLHLYAWVFSSFLLTQTATTVVFGKLADLYGRRPVLLAGIAVFLAGSLLCGAAWSMPSLIAFRLVQGVGAGAIQPVGLTVVGDLYPAHERGRIQGYLASVWGVSSVLGPLAGGLIIQHLGWPWIFWINVPVGLAAAAGFLAFLHEDVARVEPAQVDVAGAALFTVAVAALMVALTEVGARTGRWRRGRVRLPRGHGPARAPGTAGDRPDAGARPVGAPPDRDRQRRHAAERHGGHRAHRLPADVRPGRHGPLRPGRGLRADRDGAGLADRRHARGQELRPLRPAPDAALRRRPPAGGRRGLRRPAARTARPRPRAWARLVMGFGMGFLSTAAIVIVQGSVGWAERGVATASNIFSRNLGSALGAAVLGGVLNLGLAHAGAAAVGPDQVRRLLDQPGGATAGDAAVRAVLHQALHLTFWAVLLLTVLTLLLALLVPPVEAGRGAREIAAAD